MGNGEAKRNGAPHDINAVGFDAAWAILSTRHCLLCVYGQFGDVDLEALLAAAVVDDVVGDVDGDGDYLIAELQKAFFSIQGGLL